MKKSGVVILSALLIGALGLMAAVPVAAPTVESIPEASLSDSQTDQQNTESLTSIPADGLVTQDGQTCYYLAGEKQTGLQYIDGKAYVFDESGNMLKSGWYTVEGCTFYLNDSGSGVVKCWRLGEDGKYRYLKLMGRWLSMNGLLIMIIFIMSVRTGKNKPVPKLLTEQNIILMKMAYCSVV